MLSLSHCQYFSVIIELHFFTGAPATCFCFHRSGIQLVRKDSKAWVLLSTEVQIAVYLCMM